MASKEERITQLEEDIELVLECNKDLMDQMSAFIRRENALLERLEHLEKINNVKGK